MWTKKAVRALALSALCGGLGLALSSLALVALCGAILLALAVTAGQARRPTLEVARALERERYAEGDDVPIEITVRNKGASTVLLEVADVLPDTFRLKEGSNRKRLVLPPGAEAAHRFVAQAPVKGVFSLDAIVVRVQDALGFFEHESRFSAPAPVTVLPLVQDLRKVPAKTKFPLVFLGSQTVRAPGQGMEFFGLREYLPGDPLKEVNWKASVRSTGLVVNQREKETLADVTILLDARDVAGYGRADDNAFLWQVRAVASLTEFFVQRRDRVRLVVYGDSVHVIEPDGGQRHLYRILDALAGMTPGGSIPFSEAVHRVLPRLHRKSPVLVVGSLVDDPTLVPACALLQGHAMHTLVLAVEPRGHASSQETQTLVDLERKLTIDDLRGGGTSVIEWAGNDALATSLMEVPA